MFSKKGLGIFLLFLVTVLTSCQKKLTSGGTSVFSLVTHYIQKDSVIGVYSYKNGSPEFVVSLEANPGSAVAIPESITRPTFSLGQPTNPLLYYKRLDPSVPVPLDLFVKVYNPSESTLDYYFEVPVLGAIVNPTNTTTALSWILRWSYSGAGTLYLSQNQFDAIMAQIEVACSNCRSKTNADIVQFILNDKNLRNKIDSLVKSNTINKNVPALQYAPPNLDFAFATSVIKQGDNKSWSFIYNVGAESNFNFDVILYNPMNSLLKYRPSRWKHDAFLLSTEPGTLTLYPDILASPLSFVFNDISKGSHSFQGFITDVTGAPAIELTVTTGNLNQKLLCENEAPIIAKTNKKISANLYKVITPVPTNDKLKVSPVAVTDLKELQNAKYILSFSAGADASGNPTMNYSVNSFPFDNSSGAYVTTPVPITTGVFYTGLPLIFQGVSLVVQGEPVNGDEISFVTPYDKSNFNIANLFTDRLGCFDYSVKKEEALTFSSVKASSCDVGPASVPSIPDTAGLVIAANGSVSWLPTTSFYNGANAPADHKYKFCFLVNGNKEYALLQLTEDNLPVVELLNSNYFLPIFTGQTDSINPSYTALSSLPLAPHLYFEGTALREVFKIIDPDGNPVKISVQVATTSPSKLIADNIPVTTSFNTFTKNKISATISQFLWIFSPSYNQVNKNLNGIDSGGNLIVKFVINYDTSLDPTLTTMDLGSYTLPLTVQNAFDKPSLSGTTDTTTGFACAATNNCLSTQLYTDPSLVQVSSDATTFSNASRGVDVRTGQYLSDQSGRPIYSIVENSFAALKIPAILNAFAGFNVSGPTLNAPGTLLVFGSPAIQSAGQRLAISFVNSSAASTVKVETSTDRQTWSVLPTVYTASSGTATVNTPLTNPSGTYYINASNGTYYRFTLMTLSGGSVSLSTQLSPAPNISYYIKPTLSNDVIQGSQCLFLRNLNNSNFAVRPYPATGTPTHFVVKLNQIDGIQYKIPYFSNPYCEFTFSVINNSISGSLTTTLPLTYRIYLQDLSSGFQDVSQEQSLVTSYQKYYSNYPYSASPYETYGFDLVPFILRNFWNTDNGLYSANLTKASSSVFNFGVTNTNYPYSLVGTDLYSNVEKWFKPLISDNTTDNSYFAPISLTLSGTFSAQVKFETSTDNLNWSSATSKQISAVDGSLTSKTNPITTTGTFLINIPTGSKYFRAQVSQRTSGSVTATINNYKSSDGQRSFSNQACSVAPCTLYNFDISQYYAVNVPYLQIYINNIAYPAGTVPGTVYFYFSSDDGTTWNQSGLIANVDNTPTNPNRSFYVQVPSNAKWFKTVTVAGTSTNGDGTKSSVLRLNLTNAAFGKDPRQLFQWKCWILSPTASSPPVDSDYTACTDTTVPSLALDEDGNSYFAPSISSNVFSNFSASWTPPISAAGQTLTIKLRAIDKGYYPNLSALPASTVCNTADPSAPASAPSNIFSCRDLSFSISPTLNGVNEVPALPFVDIADGAYNPIDSSPTVITTLSPYNNNAIYPNRVYSSPLFELPDSGARSFHLRVRPYSAHSVDAYQYQLSFVSCFKDGIRCSDDPKYKDNVVILLSDPKKYNSSCTPPSSSNFTDCNSIGFFDFSIHPDATDGINVVNKSILFQVYRYTFNLKNLSNGVNTNFQFNIKVNKTR